MSYISGGGGSGSIIIDTTPIVGGVVGNVLMHGVGDVVREYEITGTGKVVMDTEPLIITPSFQGDPAAQVLFGDDEVALKIEAASIGPGSDIPVKLEIDTVGNVAFDITDNQQLQFLSDGILSAYVDVREDRFTFNGADGSAASADSGVDFAFQGGQGVNDGDGGSFRMEAGNAPNGGNGGSFNLTAGGSSDGNGGIFSIRCGISGTGEGGSLSIEIGEGVINGQLKANLTNRDSNTINADNLFNVMLEGGAQRDGSSDDQAEFQRAIDSGRHIYVPGPGTYSIGDPGIVISNANQTLILGPGVTLKTADGADQLIVLSAAGTSVVAEVPNTATLDGNRTNTTAVTIVDIEDVADCQIIGLNITNGSEFGIRIGDAPRPVIKGNHISNTADTSIQNVYTTVGDNAGGVYSDNVCDRTSEDPGSVVGNGILIHGDDGTGVFVTDFAVQNNKVLLPQDPTGDHLGIEIFNGKVGVIEGNIVEGGSFGISVAAGSSKIAVVGNTVNKVSSLGIEIAESSQCSVIGNTSDCADFGGTPIIVDTTDLIAVTGNTCNGESRGIQFKDDTRSTASGNTITINADGSGFFSQGSDGLVIGFNTYRQTDTGSGSAIYMLQPTNTEIAGGFSSGFESLVEVDGGDTHSGNRFYLPQGPDATIRVQFDAGVWDTDNIVSGYPAAFFALTDAANIELDCLQSNDFSLTLTGNHTIDPPINPMEGKRLTIAITASGGNFTPTLASGAGGFRYISGVPPIPQIPNGETIYVSTIYNLAADRHDVISLATNNSGTYTPTLTNTTNLTGSTAYVCQYMRVGNVVTVSGRVDVDPTIAGSAVLGISLPIPSNFANSNECGGVAFASGIAGQGAAILADATNNRATMQWIAADITNQPMFFSFTYLVI